MNFKLGVGVVQVVSLFLVVEGLESLLRHKKMNFKLGVGVVQDVSLFLVVEGLMESLLRDKYQVNIFNFPTK